MASLIKTPETGSVDATSSKNNGLNVEKESLENGLKVVENEDKKSADGAAKNTRERLRQSLTMYIEQLKNEDTEKTGAEGKKENDEGIVTEIIEKIKKDFVPTQCKTEDAKSSIPSEGIKCDLCNLTLRNRDLYDFHINGLKHKKQLKIFMTTGTTAKPEKESLKKCTTCNVELKTEEYKKHLETDKHKDNEKSKKEKVPTKKETGQKAAGGSPQKTSKQSSINKKIQGGKNERRPPAFDSREKCYTCNRAGHFARDCPDSNTKEIRCYNCDRPGHFAKDCRSTANSFSRQSDVFYCDVCQIYTRSDAQLLEHFRSLEHHDLLKEAERNDSYNQSEMRRKSLKRRAEDGRDDMKRTRFWCEECRLGFGSPHHYEDHLRSREHRQQVESYGRPSSSRRSRSSQMQDIQVWEREPEFMFQSRNINDSRMRDYDMNHYTDQRSRDLDSGYQRRGMDYSDREPVMQERGILPERMHFPNPREEQAYYSRDDVFSQEERQLERERRRLQDRLDELSSRFTRRF